MRINIVQHLPLELYGPLASTDVFIDDDAVMHMIARATRNKKRECRDGPMRVKVHQGVQPHAVKFDPTLRRFYLVPVPTRVPEKGTEQLDNGGRPGEAPRDSGAGPAAKNEGA